MMREILFRARHLDPYDEKGWYYGYYERSDNTYHYIIEENGSIIPINLRTVGQYTGLKDRNGTKIFEGDIVRCVSRTDEAKMVVIFEEGEFCMIPVERFNSYNTSVGYYGIRSFEKEVIGNIYDNSELLKGESK